MTTNDTYLAVFLGSKTSPRMTAWMALPDAERRAKEQEGMAAWKTWVEKHHAAVAVMGGPLGKTKKVSERGIEDVSNEMSGFMVVRAESHEAGDIDRFQRTLALLPFYFQREIDHEDGVLFHQSD